MSQISLYGKNPVKAVLHKHPILKSCRLADIPAYLSIIAFIMFGVIDNFLFIGGFQSFADSNRLLQIQLSNGLSRSSGGKECNHFSADTTNKRLPCE